MSQDIETKTNTRWTKTLLSLDMSANMQLLINNKYGDYGD